MSIATIQSKYPSAIWFDSAHSGTESGTVDEPFNTFTGAMAAASDGGVIAVKDGTHTTSNITLAKSLTFVGESTSAIISSTGTSYGGVFNANNTSHSIKVETLKLFHNSSSPVYGLITAGNTSDATVTVEGCILEMGPLTLAVSTNRGWFTASTTPTTSLTISDTVILGGTSATSLGVVVGGDHFQDGFNVVDIQRCTIVVTGGSGNKLSSYSAGITSSTFKNNIFVGNGNSETIGFTPITYLNNCHYNNGETTGGTDNLFSTDPQFVNSSTGDYRLRPTSPCIGAGTAS